MAKGVDPSVYELAKQFVDDAQLHPKNVAIKAEITQELAEDIQDAIEMHLDGLENDPDEEEEEV